MTRLHHLVQRLDERCPHCGGPVWYSSYAIEDGGRGWDAKFCKACDVWLEEGCDDPTCEYCAYRPKRPSAIARELDEEEYGPLAGRPADET